MRFSKYKNYKRYHLGRQFFLINLAVFLFFTAMIADAQNSAVVVQSTHATRLIRSYLKNHPEEIIRDEKTGDDTITKLNQLQKISNSQLAEISAAEPQIAILPQIFPIHSNALTPGKVRATRIHLILPHPIFIVGDDATSKIWLQRYANRLTQLHAIGFVDNVASKESFDKLTKTFPRLSLLPIPANSISKTLGIKHYPVLISDKLIEQ